MVTLPDPKVFAALADPTRLDVVERLRLGGERSTTQLAAGTRLSRQAVRKHLAMLASAGIVVDQRVGRQRLWRLDPTPLAPIGAWTSHVRSTWEARFGQLDALLALPEHPGANDDR